MRSSERGNGDLFCKGQVILLIKRKVQPCNSRRNWRRLYTYFWVHNRCNSYKINVIFVRTVNILTVSIGKYSSEGIHGNKDNKIIEDSRGNKGDKGKGGEDINQ